MTCEEAIVTDDRSDRGGAGELPGHRQGAASKDQRHRADDGRAMTDRIDAARVRMGRSIFARLSELLSLRVGRDYTTVSRQVAKLDELGLVVRSARARRLRSG
jgi:hypothetical protein